MGAGTARGGEGQPSLPHHRGPHGRSARRLRAADGVARSRVTGVDVAVGKRGDIGPSTLPRRRRCERRVPAGGCLETHVVRVPPTRADRLSVTLTGIKPVVGRLRREPPRVVEVRINGRDWSEIARSGARDTCAPLFAVDGRPVPVRLPADPTDVLGGELLKLKGCEPIRLGPGRHRIESLPGLSGAVLTTSLVPLGEKRASAPNRPPEREGGAGRSLPDPTRPAGQGAEGRAADRRHAVAPGLGRRWR